MWFALLTTCLFAKCASLTCSHCPRYPVRATKFMSFLRLCGGHVFSPCPSPHHNGHYLTYHECAVQRDLHRSFPAPDVHLPSREPQRCASCPNYVFASQSDKEKHQRQVHGGQRKRQQAGQGGQPAKVVCHRCSYGDCAMVFSSRYQLTQHKQREGHILPKGRPKKQ